LTQTDWAIWSLPLAAALDAALGDPEGWPHPVRAIGSLISASERALRAVLARVSGGPVAERVAGVVLALAVVSIATLTAWLVMIGCDEIGGPAALVSRAILIYWGLATRSLGNEALRVAQTAELASARRALARVVGRETSDLGWPEIDRACVETVAENVNDAVVAPLFWYAVAGPPGLWAFKAINTLDSMVGYRDDRFQYLGWASARLDDLAGLMPARLTWVLIALASLLLGERAGSALRIGWRDGRKHTSPNAAWGEAAMAGALGVQLGGPATYGGIPRPKPLLGNSGEAILPATVRRTVVVMYVTAALAVAIVWTFRVLVIRAA
jgi:adenosylcobinamide-phosphate synthase